MEMTTSKRGRRLMETLARYGFVASEREVHGGSGDITFVRV